MHEFARLIQVIIDCGFGIDPQRMINRGQELRRMHGIFRRRRRGGIRFSIQSPPLNAGAKNTNWTLQASVNASGYNVTALFVKQP